MSVFQKTCNKVQAPFYQFLEVLGESPIGRLIDFSSSKIELGEIIIKRDGNVHEKYRTLRREEYDQWLENEFNKLKAVYVLIRRCTGRIPLNKEIFLEQRREKNRGRRDHIDLLKMSRDPLMPYTRFQVDPYDIRLIYDAPERITVRFQKL